MIIQQYSCARCLKDVDDEDVIWADVKGNLTTMSGYPYCQSCAPEEPIKELCEICEHQEKTGGKYCDDCRDDFKTSEDDK